MIDSLFLPSFLTCPAGNLTQLFQLEREATDLTTRFSLIDRFNALTITSSEEGQGQEQGQGPGPELTPTVTLTLTDAARMAGCLIRWLLELVESRGTDKPAAHTSSSSSRRPPAKAGAGYDLAGFVYSETLLDLTRAVARPLHANPPVLFNALPGAAKTAWKRLMTPAIFPHLPLASGVLLAAAAPYIRWEEDQEQKTARVIVLALTHAMSAREPLFDLGGRMSWLCCEGVALPALGRDIGRETLMNSYADRSVKRLSLVAYNEMLKTYDPATRTFDKDDFTKVRG
jgi:hypothetical protein